MNIIDIHNSLLKDHALSLNPARTVMIFLQYQNRIDIYEKEDFDYQTSKYFYEVEESLKYLIVHEWLKGYSREEIIALCRLMKGSNDYIPELRICVGVILTAYYIVDAWNLYMMSGDEIELEEIM